VVSAGEYSLCYSRWRGNWCSDFEGTCKWIVIVKVRDGSARDDADIVRTELAGSFMASSRRQIVAGVLLRAVDGSKLHISSGRNMYVDIDLDVPGRDEGLLVV